MSMKRILGMMLASRMAGRGGGFGKLAGGGLGGLAAASLLGRGKGMGGKAGLAALGYLAYRAYQDHQSKAVSNPQAGDRSAADRASASPQTPGFGAAFDGIIKSVSEALSGNKEPGAGTATDRQPVREGQQAAEALTEATALLLLRGMVTAANSDGSISPEERSRIVAHAAANDPDDRNALERELANPRPLEELLSQVTDRETAEEFYLASRLAVEGGTATHRAYLAYLRERLGLGEKEVADIETLVS